MNKAHSEQTPQSDDVNRYYAVTADSVAAARAAQERERAEFTMQTGVGLTPDGQLRRSSYRIDPLRGRRH